MVVEEGGSLLCSDRKFSNTATSSNVESRKQPSASLKTGYKHATSSATDDRPFRATKQNVYPSGQLSSQVAKEISRQCVEVAALCLLVACIRMQDRYAEGRTVNKMEPRIVKVEYSQFSKWLKLKY